MSFACCFDLRHKWTHWLVGCVSLFPIKSLFLNSHLFLNFRYKKDQDIALVATCTLHNLLNASLLSESGPPLIEFEVTHCEFAAP